MSQKILVVDDSRTIRRVVDWVFHGSPYTVIPAATASEALQLIRAERPDVALIDYALPDSSGFDLCMELKTDADLDRIPLIMLAGNYAGPFDESRVAGCGADDFIYKPFRTDALIEKVTTVVSKALSRPVQFTPQQQDAAPSTSHLRPISLDEAPDPMAPPSEAAATGGSGFRRLHAAAAPSAANEMVAPEEEAVEAPAAAEAVAEVAEQPIAEVAVPAAAPVEEAATQPDEEVAEVAEEPVAAPEPEQEPVAAEAEELEALDDDDVETLDADELEEAEEEEVAAAPEPGPQEAITAEVPAQIAPRVVVDDDVVKAAVREMLPGLVRDLLAGLLRQTIGARVEQYAVKKIDDFVENDLPSLAEAAIEKQLSALAGQIDE